MDEFKEHDFGNGKLESNEAAEKRGNNNNSPIAENEQNGTAENVQNEKDHDGNNAAGNKREEQADQLGRMFPLVTSRHYGLEKVGVIDSRILWSYEHLGRQLHQLWAAYTNQQLPLDCAHPITDPWPGYIVEYESIFDFDGRPVLLNPSSEPWQWFMGRLRRIVFKTIP